MAFHMDPIPRDMTAGLVGGHTAVLAMDGTALTVADLVEDLANDVHHRVCALQPDGVVRALELKFARRVDGDTQAVTLTLDDGAVVHCTDGQMLLTPDGTWVRAGTLRTGDELLTIGQAHLRLGIRWDPERDGGQRRRVSAIAPATPTNVYEFGVEQHLHNVIHPSGIVLHD